MQPHKIFQRRQFTFNIKLYTFGNSCGFTSHNVKCSAKISPVIIAVDFVKAYGLSINDRNESLSVF